MDTRMFKRKCKCPGVKACWVVSEEQRVWSVTRGKLPSDHPCAYSSPRFPAAGVPTAPFAHPLFLPTVPRPGGEGQASVPIHVSSAVECNVCPWTWVLGSREQLQQPARPAACGLLHMDRLSCLRSMSSHLSPEGAQGVLLWPLCPSPGCPPRKQEHPVCKGDSLWGQSWQKPSIGILKGASPAILGFQLRTLCSRPQITVPTERS